ncbi:MAG: hypothetical protein IH583_12310 [Candidatus Aminicenantes bacterium]|nr:hypothetical protein [Candidatus Aminicenantes bacterium]
MKAKWLIVVFLAAFALGTISCYRPYGSRFYPDTPRFAPTDPRGVELLRREPRRDHIRLGEVWIRPSYRMNRFYVEGVLREKAAALGAEALVIVADRYFRDRVVYSYWHGPRAVYERHIVGIAIRYRR